MRVRLTGPRQEARQALALPGAVRSEPGPWASSVFFFFFFNFFFFFWCLLSVQAPPSRQGARASQPLRFLFYFILFYLFIYSIALVQAEGFFFCFCLSFVLDAGLRLLMF
jgi:hypothetical protein